MRRLPALLAGLLCLRAALAWPLWEAELWTARVAALPLGALAREVAADRHPPLFFALERLVLVLDDGDLALRAVSVLSAVAFVAWVARRHAGAAVLLALLPFVQVYGATARAGMLTAALAAVAWDACERLRAEGRGAAALAAALALGLWAHYAMALAWVACTLSLATVSRERRGAAALALLVPALSFLPWALGPMAAQQGVGDAHAGASATVLGWPLWPVGPSWVPALSLVLVPLAIAGLDRAAVPWLVAGVAVPLLWSSDPATRVKWYLYAPLLAPFATWVARGLDRAGPIGLVLGVAAGVWDTTRLATLPSSPASLVGVTRAVYDLRVEAQALARVPGAAEGLGPAAGPALQGWVRYAPALAPALETRAPRWEAHTRATRPPPMRGCVLDHAFSAVLAVPPAECDAVRAAIAGVPYAPFLVERGDEASLREAIAIAPAWATPDVRLAALLTDDEAAWDVLAGGARRAWSWGQWAGWQEALVAMEARAAKAGWFERRDEARATLACVSRAPPGPWAARCVVPALR